VVSGVCYVSTYEMARHQLERRGIRDTKVKALVGGSCASLVGQTVIVPFDVISQHVMVLGLTQSSPKVPPTAASPLAINTDGRSKAQVTRDIIRTIYQRDGLRGFYRGYVAALCNYVPSSASWWTFYSLYQEAFGQLPGGAVVPHTVVQCGAAVLSGCTTSLLTNPLDLIRTRVQVQRRTIPDTVRILWEQEGLNIFRKGLTARMTSSCIYSLAVIFGYETVKKMCVLGNPELPSVE
jgi:solute carrier family 25 protein 44